MKIGTILSSKTFALFVAISGSVIFGTQIVNKIHKTWQQNLITKKNEHFRLFFSIKVYVLKSNEDY
jgi:hypothetical protein